MSTKMNAEGKMSWALKVLFIAALGVIAAAALVAWIFWNIASHL